MRDARTQLADALHGSTARIVLVPRAALAELILGATTEGVRLTLSDDDVLALARAAWNTSPMRLDEFGPWGYEDHPGEQKATLDAARRTIERLLSGKDDW